MRGIYRSDDNDRGPAYRPDRRERFLRCDTASRYGITFHCCLDNVSMSTLADTRFFTRCAKFSSCREPRYNLHRNGNDTTITCHYTRIA